MIEIECVKLRKLLSVILRMFQAECLVDKESAHVAKKVVVVDDDADACLCLRDTLSEDGGYDCVGICTSAGHALIEIPRINPDLVLMDIHLPDINGIECTRRLRELMPFLKVIMVTGIRDENTIVRSLQAGAIGYLVKSVTPDQCRATLAKVLK